MKKVLAIVLALVMVCTMAMAVTMSTTGGVATTTTLTAKDYKVIDDFETNQTNALADDVTITLTTKTPLVEKVDDDTTTTYYADKYVVTGSDTVLATGTYYAVDASSAVLKLVKGSKVVYLSDDAAFEDTQKVVAKTVKYAEGAKLACGDYEVPHTGYKVDDDTTLYIINDKAYVADVAGTGVAVLNGAFVKYDDTAAVDLVGHDFTGEPVNTDKGVITAAHCKNCDKYIPVVKTASIPVTTLDKYEACTGLVGYSYLVKAVAITETTTTTTNPDTGANDVIGVAAALAVVALVSGAAISLKK